MTLHNTDPAIIPLQEFNVDTAINLKWLLFNDSKTKWAKWAKLLEDPVFAPKFNTSLDEKRDIAYAQIKRVCDEGIVSIFDF